MKCVSSRMMMFLHVQMYHTDRRNMPLAALVGGVEPARTCCIKVAPDELAAAAMGGRQYISC